MVDTQHFRPREMDLDRPCAARIFDAFLGGSHNFGLEREFVERTETALPGITSMFRENRAFVRRTVEYLISSGIRQFLDIGSGIPTIGYVHEVARRRTRDFRVLYVENEPLTVAHSRGLLTDEPRVEITHADARDPASIRQTPEAAELLDFTEPVGLLMSAVLHFLDDSDGLDALLETYRGMLCPGSHLLISHVTDAEDGPAARTLCDLYADTADPLVARDTDRITALFGDFEPLAPGASYLTDWRPDQDSRVHAPTYRLLYGGLARKPGC